MQIEYPSLTPRDYLFLMIPSMKLEFLSKILETLLSKLFSFSRFLSKTSIVYDRFTESTRFVDWLILLKDLFLSRKFFYGLFDDDFFMNLAYFLLSFLLSFLVSFLPICFDYILPYYSFSFLLLVLLLVFSGSNFAVRIL